MKRLRVYTRHHEFDEVVKEVPYGKGTRKKKSHVTRSVELEVDMEKRCGTIYIELSNDETLQVECFERVGDAGRIGISTQRGQLTVKPNASNGITVGSTWNWDEEKLRSACVDARNKLDRAEKLLKHYREKYDAKVD